MGDRKMHGIGSRADYSCYRCPYGSSPDRRSGQAYRTLAANRAASRRTVAAKVTAANFRAEEIEECGFTANVETHCSGRIGTAEDVERRAPGRGCQRRSDFGQRPR